MDASKSQGRLMGAVDPSGGPRQRRRRHGSSHLQLETRNRFVLDDQGDVVGRVIGFLDTRWGGWIAVDVGRLHQRWTLAPLKDSYLEFEDIVVPWPRTVIASAPKLPSGYTGTLASEVGWKRLLEYYGLPTPTASGEHVPDRRTRS